MKDCQMKVYLAEEKTQDQVALISRNKSHISDNICW